jgi:hypothetical protein
MHFRVLRTFLAAQLAGLSARIQHGFEENLVASRPAGGQLACGGAHIGAVHAQSDALGELLGSIFA